MHKRKGFNMVELMLTMMLLGIIAALTLPLLKNLKDDDDVYRAYLKKANQDVTDIISMAFIKNKSKGIINFNRLGRKPHSSTTVLYPANATGLQELFLTAVKGSKCTGTACLADLNFSCTTEDKKCPASKEVKTAVLSKTSPAPGIKLQGKTILMFKWEKITGTADNPATFGYVFFDINGDKGPNQLCKDRYKFQLLKNSAKLIVCPLEFYD